MSRSRVWMVAILAGIIVLGHAWDICAQTDHWPFSRYSMYGRLQPLRKLTLYSLRAGVKKNGRSALIEVTDDTIPQLSEVRLRNILLTAWTVPADRKQSIDNVSAIMRDFLTLYEMRRTKHLHDGPQINTLHFCRITWKLNDDGHAFHPKVEELIVMDAHGTITQLPPKPATQPADAIEVRDE